MFALLLVMPLLLAGSITTAAAAEWDEIKSLIGSRDAILLSDPAGRILIQKNGGHKLIPASILKIFTSLVVLHYLGPEFRFQTEFYLDDASNLKIKGYGDPLLISEFVDVVSRLLAALVGGSNVVNNLILDDSHFSQPLTIPGISSSSQPYDAPNGALCVNFNTVNFKRTKSGYTSAEPQTPLLSYAEKKIKALQLKSGRYVLSHVANENTIYTGELFRYFLSRHGLQMNGNVKLGRVNDTRDRLIYRYISRFTVAEIIARLLEHSNNFTTNQLLITSGVKAFGAPGNLEKGVRAALEYAGQVLHIADLSIVEGSGISRDNRVSAHQMLAILDAFEPHRFLMRQQGREYYKTGTLHGISTRAGFITGNNGGRYRYVVMINTPGKSTEPVMRKIMKHLDGMSE
ncbi:MAG: D-alanyl-D-alanine carboxypeptidase [Desulfobacterales bacterium]|nr:MAG: D-alanyl-D-alanine carboxypeptidase [Desulfobacterales bacterium]